MGTVPETKRCPKCGETKLANLFYRAPRRYDDLDSTCKSCIAAYRSAHRDETRARNQAYYATHKEQLRQYAREYNESHYKERSAYNAVYRAEHQDDAAEHGRAWRAENPERVAAYREKNRERTAKQAAAWRAAHPGYSAEYYAANLERYYEYSCDRYAKKKAAAVLGPVDYTAILQRDGDICWLCKQSVPESEFNLDHAIALSKGGEHSTRNLRVAHEACNKSKGARDITHQPFLL